MTTGPHPLRRPYAGAWADQDAQAYEEAPPPQAAAPEQPDKLEQLEQLGELRDSGVLTEAEFEAQEAKVLAG